MKELLSIVAGVIVASAFIPYAIDIARGKVKPARSARIMFAVLMIIALFQQRELGAWWLLAVTVGDGIGAIAILVLSLKKGVGGLKRLDMICYGLLVIDVFVWLTTQNVLLALHLTVLADLIAFTPTLVKTWKHPQSETALFFILGAVGPLLNIIAVGEYGYAVLLFPFYLALANGIEVLLIYRRSGKQLLL